MARKASVWTRRDRLADVLVIGVVAVALLLGWGAMSLAEGRSQAYAGEGWAADYPAGWLIRDQEGAAFQAVDPQSGDFETRYEVRVQPLGATEAVTPSLTLILNNTSLARATGAGLAAYRLLGVTEGEPVAGGQAMEARYVFVDEGGNVYLQQLPAVVLGLDVAVARDDQAYIFTLQAARDDFEAAQRAFRRFVASARFE